MGAECWMIRKPYEQDVALVLAKHQDEILEETPDWPEIWIGDGSPGSVPGWSTPTTACCLIPVPEKNLLSAFGSLKPQISVGDTAYGAPALWEEIPRGQGRYFVLYDSDVPAEVCFIGYSFD